MFKAKMVTLFYAIYNSLSCNVYDNNITKNREVNIPIQQTASYFLHKMPQYQYYIDFNKSGKHTVIPIEITKQMQRCKSNKIRGIQTEN